MTLTLPYWGLVALICLGGFIGWAITSLAYTTDPRPGQDFTRPSGQRSPLPRPGYLLLDDPDPLGAAIDRRPADPFVTPPLGFESMHHAAMQAHQLEIREMFNNYPYPPH